MSNICFVKTHRWSQIMQQSLQVIHVTNRTWALFYRPVPEAKTKQRNVVLFVLTLTCNDWCLLCVLCYAVRTCFQESGFWNVLIHQFLPNMFQFLFMNNKVQNKFSTLLWFLDLNLQINQSQGTNLNVLNYYILLKLH